MTIHFAYLIDTTLQDNYLLLTVRTDKGRLLCIRDYRKHYDDDFIDRAIPFYYVKENDTFYPRLAYFAESEVPRLV